MIAIIVAKARNDVIGRANDLPWRLSADLQRFKQLTTGHPVIMGRNTCWSIFNRLKKPLPDRRNIVLTSRAADIPSGFEAVPSLEEALQRIKPSETAYIIGGARVFSEALTKAVVDELYITEVDADVEGDVYFPQIDMTNWHEIASEAHPADANNQYPFIFKVYTKHDKAK